MPCPYHDRRISALVDDGRFTKRGNGELLGGEILKPVDFSIDDPLVVMGFVTGGGNGLEVVVVLKIWVEVFLPIELVDDEVDVVVFVGRHILDQKRAGTSRPSTKFW